MEDIQRCQQENVWTYTDDTAALATMAGAAEAVLAAHGGNAAIRTQAALQGASDSANRAQASVNASCCGWTSRRPLSGSQATA